MQTWLADLNKQGLHILIALTIISGLVFSCQEMDDDENDPENAQDAIDAGTADNIDKF